jgi:hypothetical protein
MALPPLFSFLDDDDDDDGPSWIQEALNRVGQHIYVILYSVLL